MSGRWRRAAALWVIAAAGGLSAWAISPRAKVSDAPTPEWREGPVRYIITKSEDTEYKQLKTEEDRRRFIDAFWRRRDPTPDTPGNEFRSQFWKRVRDANGLYSHDTTTPGWLTDMGKIHIMFGPPDEIQREDMAEGHRGTVLWIYRNSPSVGNQKLLSGPNQIIAFAQDGSGDFHLTAEPTRVADVWEGLPNPQPAFGPYKAQLNYQAAFEKAYAKYIGLSDPLIRAAGGPARESPLSTMMILARLQEPPEEWNLNADVTTREFFGSLPFRARADFFKTSGDETQVILTVAVRSRSVTYREGAGGDEPAVEVFARILDSTLTQNAPGVPATIEMSPSPENREAGIDDDLLFQCRVALQPGAYVARLSVTDSVGSRSGTSDTPFTAPDFRPAGLSISSVSVARKVEPVSDREAAVRPVFVLGGMRVVPRLGTVLRQDEDLAFYYQIYGAARDPATGQPKLDVEYVLFSGEGDQPTEIGRVNFASQTSEAHGYSLPLKGFPPGAYLVRIEVADTVAGQKATRDLLFKVVEAS